MENTINNFIRKWCGDSAPHLLDNDENDGETLRYMVAEKDSQIASLKELVREAMNMDAGITEFDNWLKRAKEALK